MYLFGHLNDKHDEGNHSGERTWLHETGDCVVRRDLMQVIHGDPFQDAHTRRINQARNIKRRP